MRAHALVFAYLAALAPALLMAFTQPVWSLVDEAQHFDFIVQLAHGVYPVADMTPISRDTLAISQQTGVYRAFYPPGTYPTPDLSDGGPPPAGMNAEANAAWMQRHMWQLSHESVQTPGYYVLMVPLWWIGNAAGGPWTAIYLLRVVNAMLVAALAPLAVAVARMVMPLRSDVAFWSAVFAGLLPGLDLNLTRVSNDALATVLGALVVVMAVRHAGRPWSWRRVAAAGLLLGAGLFVKLTLAGLYPALAISMLWPGSAATWRSRLARSVAAGVIAVACLVPWFLVNLHAYGGAMPGARAARISDTPPQSLNGPFAVLDAAVFVLTYWTGEPWGTLAFSGALAIVGSLIALMAPAGIARLLRSGSESFARPALAVACASVVTMVILTLALPASGGFEFVAPGRYAYPALPAAACLCSIGLCSLLTRTIARRLAGGVFAGMSAAAMLLAAAGLPGSPAAGTGAPPATAAIVGATASGQFGGLTIAVDRVGLDAEGKATWFEITATNTGRVEVEWTVPPVVSFGGDQVKADYLRSTRLPGDLDPGQSVTGWIHVPLDPAGVRGHAVHLEFVDVAPEGYGAIGSVDIDVNVA